MSLGQARFARPGVASMVGVAAASYAVYAGLAWVRYGHPAPAAPEDTDAFLDRFMLFARSSKDAARRRRRHDAARLRSRRLDKGTRMGRARRRAGARDCDGSRYTAVAGERRLPEPAVSRLCRVQRARLREDRVDAAGRCCQRRHLGRTNRDTCRRDGRGGQKKVPMVLGTLLSRDRADSQDLAAPCQERSRVPRRGVTAGQRGDGWSKHQTGSGRSTEIVVPPSGGTSM